MTHDENRFSTSMNVELWGTGVTMHAHVPLYVVTKVSIHVYISY
jgi:hypothetical protein